MKLEENPEEISSVALLSPACLFVRSWDLSYKWVTSRVLIKQVMCRLGKGSAESFVQNARKHP